MQTANSHARAAGVVQQSHDVTYRGFRAVTLRYVLLLAINAYCCFGLMLFAQMPDSQTAEEANKSWTATTDSKGTAIPTRIIESHSHNGNQTLDKRSVQIRNSDGHFERYQDIERETLQLDATTVRITTRTFGREINGTRTLVQVTEEEKHTLPDGESDVVRITSNPDVNGALQPVQREIVETKRIGMDVAETKTTVLLPSINGGVAPVLKTDEIRRQGANDTVEIIKTTSLSDGSGSWQVGEIRQVATRQDGKNRSTEEDVSRRDAEGKLSQVSHVVSNESESASGEKRNTVEIYSVDIPGATPDGRLHLVERTTSKGYRTSATAERISEQQVEQLNPGDPSSGLHVSIVTKDKVRPGPSGAQATRTIRMRDTNGTFGVVWVDTTKSDIVPTIQIQQTQ